MTPRASAKVWPRNGMPSDPGAVGILRRPHRMRPLCASLQRQVQRLWQQKQRRSGSRARTIGRRSKRPTTAGHTPPAAEALPRPPSRDGVAQGRRPKSARRRTAARASTVRPGQQPAGAPRAQVAAVQYRTAVVRCSLAKPVHSRERLGRPPRQRRTSPLQACTSSVDRPRC